MGNLDSRQIDRPHHAKVQRDYRTQQRLIRKRKNKEAANHHKRMGKLLCNIESEERNARFGCLRTVSAADVSVEIMITDCP